MFKRIAWVFIAILLLTGCSKQPAAAQETALPDGVTAATMKRYREGADGAAAGSKNLADQGGRLQGIFSGLRGLIAPVLAYLSFDAAKQGITNLLGVGSAAENARRSTVIDHAGQTASCLPRTPVFPAGPPARPYAPYQPATRG